MAALATTPTKKDIYTEDLSSSRDKGSLFTFRNVNCVIPTPDGPRTVLESVDGDATPGKLLALMGASGAGKRTLLNALSQRMTFGTVTREVLLDGSTPSKDFQRTTGFVEQHDLHEANQTTADVPLEEKYAYVEAIIELLDLGPIADAIIDYVGSGLSVEERKRVTIGIELASKPRMLFLEEPTSGLDSEGAMSIVAFLRRLAQVENLSIICTIHQPSSVLFNQFDDATFDSRREDCLLRTDWGERRVSYPLLFETSGSSSKGREPGGVPFGGRCGMVEMSKITVGKRQRPGESQEYATPLIKQIKVVTIRLWLILRRTPSLGYALLFNSVLSAIICGVLFFQLKNSILDMQSRVFLMFFAATVIIPIVNSIEVQFVFARDLYDLRERNSKMYSWIALVSAYLLCVTPYAILGSVTFLPIFWYMPGMCMKAPMLDSHTSWLFCYRSGTVILPYGSARLYLCSGGHQPALLHHHSSHSWRHDSIHFVERILQVLHLLGQSHSLGHTPPRLDSGA
ncbi:P-loop containing nucleoside triphosphate hydrolase protein [Lipomyces tetrasporus]